MKQGILSLVFGALALTAASAASARVSVNIGINPFGFGAYPSPPVVYEVVAGTAEIQPDLGVGRNHSTI